jgi:hypothetical protein
MAIRRIEVFVDSSVLFDALKTFSIDNIGCRLASTMLTGEPPDTRDSIGLALYGIQIHDVSEIEAL